MVAWLTVLLAPQTASQGATSADPTASHHSRGCAGAGEEMEVQDAFWGPLIASVPGAWLPVPASNAWHRIGGRREERGSVKELCFVGDAALIGFHPGSVVKRQLLPFEVALSG